MPTLHYGPWLEICLTAQECHNVMDAAGAHATRGGWVTLTDTGTRQWSLLISAGIPMWVTDHPADPLGEAGHEQGMNRP